MPAGRSERWRRARPDGTPAADPRSHRARVAAASPHYGDAIATAAILSFRLGGSDGVAIEAAKWQGALGSLGFATTTVAGSGPVDVTIPGLAIDADADEGPSTAEVADALSGADVVVVENLCSLPLNPRARDVVASVLAGRPAVLHHHDLPWQRPRFADDPPPPDDPRWRHVTINELSRRELSGRGIGATTIYNSFAVPDADPPGRGRDRESSGDADARGADADALRDAVGVGPDDRLVLQPTRALARKNVAGGMAAAARLGATFWLLGPAEDGYGPELDRLVADARCPVVLGVPDGNTVGIDDVYRACDVVALPSTWEGFGNPSLESVTHRRPLLIGPYPVARELAAFGFDWFGLDDTDRLGAWLDGPDSGLLDRNLAVARAHFSLADLPGRLATVLPPM